MIYAGLTLITIGVVLRTLAIRKLKDKFTLGLQYQQYIVKTGVYKWIRHPSYLGSMLVILGTCFICEIAAIMLVTWCFFQERIAEEEKLLSNNPDYELYKSRTGKLFPRIRK